MKNEREDEALEKDSDKPKRSVGGVTADVVSTILTWILSAAILIGAVLFAFNTSPTKSIFGFRYYTILTPSMSPAYNVGDVIFVKITSGDDIQVNDVITFNPSQDSNAYLTHRVSEKYENYEGSGVTCFRTRGDANDSEDSFLIESDRIIGVVKFGVPKIGYLIRFVQLKWYFVVPIAIMMIILIYLLKAYFTDDDEDEDEEPRDEQNSKPKGTNLAPAGE